MAHPTDFKAHIPILMKRTSKILVGVSPIICVCLISFKKRHLFYSVFSLGSACCLSMKQTRLDKTLKLSLSFTRPLSVKSFIGQLLSMNPSLSLLFTTSMSSSHFSISPLPFPLGIYPIILLSSIFLSPSSPPPLFPPLEIPIHLLASVHYTLHMCMCSFYIFPKLAVRVMSMLQQSDKNVSRVFVRSSSCPTLPLSQSFIR